MSRRRIIVEFLLMSLALAGILLGIYFCLKCPDTSHMERLLAGDSQPQITEVLFKDYGTSNYTINREEELNIFCSQLRSAVLDGYVPDVEKTESAPINMTVRFAGHSDVTVTVYLARRYKPRGSGLSLSYNKDCYDDSKYYWVMLDETLCDKLKSIYCKNLK